MGPQADRRGTEAAVYCADWRQDGDESSMPLEATVLGTGGQPTDAGPLGTMTEGPVTTGPPLR